MYFFPADVLPRKYSQKFSDGRRHLKHSLFSSQIYFMIHQKILPTSFRESLNKNSQIKVIMLRIRNFLNNLENLYDLSKKASENELQIVLNPYGYWPQLWNICKWKPLGRASILLRAVCDIGKLLARKKTAKFYLAWKPIP